jgi:plasmid stability protein
MPFARRRATVLFLVCVAACHHRATADELAASLTAEGLHVDKQAEYEPKPDWVGAELGVDLVLDYEEPYQAIRFTSADLSRNHCQEGRGGIPIGAWCLEPQSSSPRRDVWHKVDALRR